MANIYTAIQLHDAVTQPLQQMTNALNITISSFEEMQKTSSNAVNINNIKSAREELAKAESSFNTIGAEIDNTALAQANFNKQVTQSSISANGLLRTIKRIAISIGAIGLFSSGFNQFKNYEQQMANVRAITQSTQQEFEALNAIAKTMGRDTVFSATEAGEAMQYLGQAGWKAKQIIAGIPGVLDLAAASGNDLGMTASIIVDTIEGFRLKANETQRVVDVMAYTAANANTDIKLMGETFGYVASVADSFNATIEQTAALIGMASSAAKGAKAGTAIRSGLSRMANPKKEAEKWLDVLGITFVDPATKQLKDMNDIIGDLHSSFVGLANSEQIAAAQAIFGQEAYNAWLAIIKQGPAVMNEWTTSLADAEGSAEAMKKIMLSTTDGIIRLHKSEIESIWIAFYEGLADGPVSEAFKNVLNAMSTSLQYGLMLAKNIIVIVSDIFNFTANNFDFLLPIIGGVVAALTAYNSVLAVSNVLKLISTVQEYAHAAAILANATAYNSQTIAAAEATIAQTGLNAAMLACPITWIVIGIIAIVAVIYLAVAAFNRLAGTSVSATGAIAGAIAVAVAFIANIFVVITNLVTTLVATVWNTFATFAEFLANVFVDPLGSVIRLFASMADIVLGILEGIANAIDTLFGSNLANAVGGWREGLAGKVEGLVGDASVEIPRMDTDNLYLKRYNYQNALDKGMGFGEGLASKFKPDLLTDFNMDNVLDNLIGADNETYDIADAFDPENTKGITETAENTKQMKDTLTSSDEELKYLRDLAEQEVINRFTTAEVKVNMNNEMNINNEMDLDGVIDYLGEGIESEMAVIAEGVY